MASGDVEEDPGREAQSPVPEVSRGRLVGRMALALGLFLASAALLRSGLRGMHDPGYLYDSTVYREMGGRRLLDHLPLYHDAVRPGLSGLFTYPPFAALLFEPLDLIPAAAYEVAFLISCLLALVASVWICVRVLRRRRVLDSLARALALAAFLLWVQPVRWTIFIGQINLLLLVAVLADVRPTGRRWRGIGIGLATGIKLTPALFVVYLLLTRQYRAAAVSVATFLTTVALAFVLLPSDSIAFWGHAVFDTRRVGPQSYVDNQSLAGLFARALHLTNLPLAATLVVSVVAACAGLSVAYFADRRGHLLAGVLAVGVTGLLVSPISWSHHWVWLVPVFVLAWHEAARIRSRRLAAVALAAVAAVWFLLTPADANHLTSLGPRVPGYLLDLGWFRAISTNTDVLLGIATLIGIAVYAWRAPVGRVPLAGHPADQPAAVA